jgi:CDP-paratose 2-epimerase
MKMKALITGSGGLIGSECVRLLGEQGWEIVGVDNDMRQFFFGAAGSTNETTAYLKQTVPAFRHQPLDIRDRQAVRDLFEAERPDFIVHTAAQPSHDKAASIPYEDFDVNAVGTLNLLVAARDFCRDSPFCFTSTNKVYGDRPNYLRLEEKEKRFDYANELDGIEHGYLAYIVMCAVSGREYTVFGYKGKQVRDQIHCRDVARLFLEFYKKPRAGEVYNIGGGRKNSLSVLETIDTLGAMGHHLKYKYDETNRTGDHICYISDLSKLHAHFPDWKLEYDLPKILDEIIERQLRP